MSSLTRRQLLKLTGLAGLGMATMPLSSFGKSGARIVIVGGGYGGAACANYLHRFDSSLDITLIESNTQFVSCPFSNKVIAGMSDIDTITFDYKKMAATNGIEIIADTATAIDTDAKKIQLSSGKQVAYDRAIVSPGVAFRWGAIENNDLASSEIMPHAWKAGEQTLILAKQLQSMPDGGTYMVSVPRAPFRGPPAPYERASLVAAYFKKNKPDSKILILDAEDQFKGQALFQEAWDKLYPDMIEWVGGSKGGEIVRIDSGAKQLFSSNGDTYKGDVVNVIPPQQAGDIAVSSGLANDAGWCEVNNRTFASVKAESVCVIGDACVVGSMEKLGHAANSQAKACAAAIVADLNSIDIPDPVLSASVYSVIGPKYAISSSTVFRLKGEKMTQVSAASSKKGAPKKTRKREAEYAKGWFRSITSEMFLT